MSREHATAPIRIPHQSVAYEISSLQKRSPDIGVPFLFIGFSKWLEILLV
jgi:hypothetical protein